MKNQFSVAYTMEGVLETLHISRATLYKLINSGELRTYRIGKRRYCTADAVLEFQCAREQATATTHV